MYLVPKRVTARWQDPRIDGERPSSAVCHRAVVDLSGLILLSLNRDCVANS